MGPLVGFSGANSEGGLRETLLAPGCLTLCPQLFSQKPDPETMSAAPGVTSTTRLLTAMSSDSLASVITTLLLTAETPTRNLLCT